MSEDIELSSFRTNVEKHSDIEEYHEIDLNEFGDTSSTRAPITSPKSLNENDFFIQKYVKSSKIKKGTLKKKKGKKKDKSPNLMDIISSELASANIPVEENVVTVVDYTNELKSYLVTSPSEQRLRRRSTHLDAEQGWVRKEHVKLHPTFPTILNNLTTEETYIPVQYVKPVIYNTTALNNYKEQMGTRFLNIELKDIKFKHHSIFSLEKLLTVKLNELYIEYNDIKKTLKDLEKEIKINRDTRDTVRQEFESISPDNKKEIRFDPTVRKYTGNLFALKEKFIKTVQMEKEIVHNICILWCDIEMVREKTGNTETPEIITLSKKSLTEDEYEDEWNESFNREFSDMLDKIEYEFVNKYLEYKEVKYTKNLDDSAKKRISKPKLAFDEDALKEEVAEIVNNIVLKDKIQVHLRYDVNIVSKAVKLEKSTLLQKYFFQVYVDDVYVCESEHFSCQSDTIPDVKFSEALSIQILPKNSTITIVLSENNREVSSLRINLADIKKNYADAEFVSKTFVYNELVEPNSKHVGSGHNIKEIALQNKMRLKSSNIFKGNLYSSCNIDIKMGWNENKNHNNMEAVRSSMQVGRQLKRLIHGIDKPSTDMLIDIINKIYNRDVSNDEDVINTIKKLTKMEVKTDDTFPIDDNSPEFIRIKLLHLRNNGGMTDVENKRIPLQASQISTELLNCLQKSKDSEFDTQYLQDKNLEMDPIEVQRFIGIKYVQKLNRNMLKNLNEYLLRKTHKDVVMDFKDLSLRSLFSKSPNLTLANMSSSTKQQMLIEACNKEQDIKVTVLKAFNLPDRNVFMEEDEDEIAGFKVRPLRPFVRVSYSGVHSQTVAAIGCHPSWSQTVTIRAKLSPLSNIQISIFDEHKTPIQDGSDDDSGHTMHYRCTSRWLGGLQVPLHTVLSLGKFRGTFKVTTPPILFGYDNQTHSRESQSLIPAITQMMKKETCYISLNITTTLSNLGGLHGYNQPIPNSEDDYLIKHLNTFVTEYTNDFPSRNISLTFIDSCGKNKCVTQFLQPIPIPDPECFPKNPKSRSESAVSKNSGLSKSSSSKSSGKRSGDDKVVYEERESLYSGMSMKTENQLEKVMAACGRYVSLIPTYEIGESHSVTLMGSELLKVLYGSPLDHTILLASYFLYLGVRCWVAIGLGLPRGHGSFVLTKYDLESKRFALQSDQIKSKGFLSKNEGCIWYVYDAVSGDRGELRDLGCPLKTVDFVFDTGNIWVNVQSSLDCENVSFDLMKSSDWQTVFNKSVFVMKNPVLSDSNLYTNTGDVEKLRTSLEAKIRDKVQKWRSHMKTIWNRYCSSLLRENLVHWEYWAFNPITEPKPAFGQRMKQLIATYKMFGFPLNMPYLNTKSVISTVKFTGLHCMSDPTVEFGLAVEIFAYPNNVLSVWVFLASITRM